MTREQPDTHIKGSLSSGVEFAAVQAADGHEHLIEPTTRRFTNLLDTTKALFSRQEEAGSAEPQRAVVKIAGLLGILGTILANIVAIGTHLNQLRVILATYFGPYFLLKIHGVVLWGTLIVFSLALLALAFWIYASFFARSSGIKKAIVLAGSALAIAGLTLGMQRMIRPIELSPIVATQSQNLVASILLQQLEYGDDTARGGFRFSQDKQATEVQAWTTAQCLFAILTQRPQDVEVSAKVVRDGLAYLEKVKVQGLGWDYMATTPPGSGVTEITAWITLTYLESLRPDVKQKIWESDTTVGEVAAAITNNVRIILSRQFESGGWSTTEKTARVDHIRTYSTTMSVWALAEAVRSGYLAPDLTQDTVTAIRNGVRYLLQSYYTNTDGVGGWWPNPNRGPQRDDFSGLTAQTLFALLRAQNAVPTLRRSIPVDVLRTFIDRGLHGTEKFVAFQEREVSSNQRVHDIDQRLEGRSETVEGSTFLWYPWALVAAVELWKSRILPTEDSESTAILLYQLLKKSADAVDFAKSDPAIYPTAEIAIAFNAYLASNFKTENIREP